MHRPILVVLILFSLTFLPISINAEQTIKWSTYLGGSAPESIRSVAIGPNGELYVAGNTSSNSFPATINSSGTGPGGYVAKLDPETGRVVRTNFFGSRLTDVTGMAIDIEGNVYVVGSTSSPLWQHATGLQSSIAGEFDGFLAKFDNAGTLIYSTYFGGTRNDYAYGVAVNSVGHAFVTGATQSLDFPIVNGYQAEYRGGPAGDAFLIEIDTTACCGPPVYSTYFAGSDSDTGNAVAVAKDGTVYIAGWTSSWDVPMLNSGGGSFQGSFTGFVAHFDTSLRNWPSLLFSSYTGGSDSTVLSVAADTEGGVYAVGATRDPFMLTTPHSWQTYCNVDADSQCSDGFVARFGVLTDLKYASYVGGSGYDVARSIAVDGGGGIVLGGGTNSPFWPTTPSLPWEQRGGRDAFAMRINPEADPGLYPLLFSTVLSGGLDDETTSVAVDATRGRVYLAGVTSSPDFPVVTDFQTHLGGGYGDSDGFVVAIDDPTLMPPPTADTTPPSIECSSADSIWHKSNVSVACSAYDNESGLANDVDASFSLVTSVQSNWFDAQAYAAGCRTICDKANNCTEVRPVGPFHIDMRAPWVKIEPSMVTTRLLHENALAEYACGEYEKGQSGIAACVGPLPVGSAIDTFTVGTHSFRVTATDIAGNNSVATVTYDVTYSVTPLYNPLHGVNSGATIPLKVALVDADGANVSSAAVPLTVTGLSQLSQTASGLIGNETLATPDKSFRFESTLSANGGYILNLSTKGFGTGTYALRFLAAGDPAEHTIQFQVD